MKSVLIIGGGISGLSAGCYAAMNGYRVKVLEMNHAPGGVCATWKRKEFLFDHCLHWVIGTGKGNSMHRLFEELNIPDTVAFYHTGRFRRIRCEGHDVTIYTDIGKLEKELIGHFPDERRRISGMMRQVRFYTRFRPPMDSDFGSFTFKEILKILPFMPSFLRLKNTTVRDYLSRFRNPVLREVLLQMFPIPDMPALMVVMPLAFFHNQEGGYPMGGSLHFAQSIADRLTGLGGEILYGKRVRSVIVESGKAAAVETEEGERMDADIVISACDARTTLFGMLEGKYVSDEWKRMFEKPSLWPPVVCVSLGVNRDLTGEVELQAFKLQNPVTLCGREERWFSFSHYCHDPAFAPKGKSAIAMQFESDYDYWKALYEDKRAYDREKQQVLDTLVSALETQFPGIRNQIEASDVATPVTWERYTGNWMGSYEGWLPVKELFGKFMPRRLPGLECFYITGQWTFPGGGVPMCMAQARKLIRQICKEDGIPFTVR